MINLLASFCDYKGYYVNAVKNWSGEEFKLYLTQIIGTGPIPVGANLTNFTYRTRGTELVRALGGNAITVGNSFTIVGGGTVTCTAITQPTEPYNEIRITFTLSWKTGNISMVLQANSIALGQQYMTFAYNEYNNSIGIVNPETFLQPFVAADYQTNVFYGTRSPYAYAQGWGEYTDTEKAQMLGTDELKTDSFLSAISKIGGGLGNYDITSDEIDEPILPVVSPLDSRFFKLYAPTSAHLSSLSNFLWSNDFSDAVIKNLYQPIDAIINLYAVNFSPPVTGEESAIVAGVETGVTMPRIGNMYTTIYCGELTIPERWGSALDYAPYTKIQIYLPFIGCRDLAVDDVMGGTIKLTYNVDMLTGSCVAIIRTTRGSLNSVLYQFDGNLTAGLPITGGGINFVYEAIQNSKGMIPAIAGGSPAAMVMAASGAAMNTASNKASLNKAGSMGGSNGVLGIKKPYLIITRPEQSLAKKFNTFRGFPSNITATLATLSGWTEVEEIHLENMGATITAPEIAEIERLLKEGVVL